MRIITLTLTASIFILSSCTIGGNEPDPTGGPAKLEDISFADGWETKGHLFTQLANGHIVLCASATFPMAQMAGHRARGELGTFFHTEQVKTKLPEGTKLETKTSVRLSNSAIVASVPQGRGATALACTDLDQNKLDKVQLIEGFTPEQNMALLDAAIEYGKKHLSK